MGFNEKGSKASSVGCSHYSKTIPGYLHHVLQFQDLLFVLRSMWLLLYGVMLDFKREEYSGPVSAVTQDDYGLILSSARKGEIFLL